jgi:hypothetical protein
MLDLLPVPALGLDLDGLVVRVNLDAQQLFGADSLLLGQAAACVLPPALAPLSAGRGGRSGARLRMVGPALARPRPGLRLAPGAGVAAGIE